MINIFKIKSYSDNIKIGKLNITKDYGINVFYNYKILNENRYEIYNNLIKENIYGIDIYGNKLKKNISSNQISTICDKGKNYNFNNTYDKISWNIYINEFIIKIIMEDIYNFKLNNYNLSYTFILEKLKDIIYYLNIGMFEEVYNLFNNLEIDEFFTDEKIKKYKNLVISSNSFIIT